MSSTSSRVRAGLTMIELLVVLAIIGLMLGLLIPAVQSGRESSRSATCAANLHDLGLALQSHVEIQQTLPSLYNGGFLPQPRSAIDEFHFHSWRTAILPFIDQAPLFSQLNLNLPATVAANQTAINVPIAIFACPSTPNGSRVVPAILAWNDGAFPVTTVGTAAPSDYEVIGGVQVAPQTKSSANLDVIRFGPWGEPTYNTIGASLRYRQARLSDITDGLSSTILVSEKAGRPDFYRKGQAPDPYPYLHSTGGDHQQAAWAISTHFWWLVFSRDQPVNTANMTGIFSFHPGGANVALADGSVRFLKETASVAVLKALTTRSGSEIESPD